MTWIPYRKPKFNWICKQCDSVNGDCDICHGCLRGKRQKPLKKWEDTMEPWEVRWCKRQIAREVNRNFHDCRRYKENGRAARAWNSSQRRRFKKLEQIDKDLCFGTYNWVAQRWNWRKFRFDKYILGLSYYYYD